MVGHPHLRPGGVWGDRQGGGLGADRDRGDDPAAERVDHDNPVDRVVLRGVLFAEHTDVGTRAVAGEGDVLRRTVVDRDGAAHRVGGGVDDGQHPGGAVGDVELLAGPAAPGGGVAANPGVDPTRTWASTVGWSTLSATAERGSAARLGATLGAGLEAPSSPELGAGTTTTGGACGAGSAVRNVSNDGANRTAAAMTTATTSTTASTPARPVPARPARGGRGGAGGGGSHGAPPGGGPAAG